MDREIRLFDSHCHLDMDEFSGDVADVLSRARGAGVRRAMLAACDVSSGSRLIELSKRHGDCGVELLASAGVHPHEAASAAETLPELKSMSSLEEVSAIG